MIVKQWFNFNQELRNWGFCIFLRLRAFEIHSDTVRLRLSAQNFRHLASSARKVRLWFKPQQDSNV